MIEGGDGRLFGPIEVLVAGLHELTARGEVVGEEKEDRRRETRGRREETPQGTATHAEEHERRPEGDGEAGQGGQPEEEARTGLPARQSGHHRQRSAQNGEVVGEVPGARPSGRDPGDGAKGEEQRRGEGDGRPRGELAGDQPGEACVDGTDDGPDELGVRAQSEDATAGRMTMAGRGR